MPKNPHEKRDRPFERPGNTHCPPRFSMMQRCVHPAVAQFQDKSNKSFTARRRKSQGLRGRDEKAEECAGKLADPSQWRKKWALNPVQNEFVCGESEKGGAAEGREDPGTHGHRRSPFENAQHVEEAQRPTEVGNQKRGT